MAGIIDAAEFKSWRGFNTSAFDTEVAFLIPIACAMIESATGVVFDAGTYTEVHNGDGTQQIIVKSIGITSITSIKSDFNSTTPITLDATTYAHDGDRTISRLPVDDGHRFGVDEMGRVNDPLVTDHPVFDRGFQNIQVIYAAGYTTANMPADLKLAAYRLVDSFFETRGEDVVYLQNKADSGANRAMRTVVESDAMIVSMVRNYRRAM